VRELEKENSAKLENHLSLLPSRRGRANHTLVTKMMLVEA